MGSSFKLGRLFGIDVKAHWTFLLLLAVFRTLGYARTGSLLGAALVADLIRALFACVRVRVVGRVWSRSGRQTAGRRSIRRNPPSHRWAGPAREVAREGMG